MNVGCCREEDFRPQVCINTHMHLGANHLCVPDGMLTLWLSGSGDRDGEQGHAHSRLCIAPVSACSFSHAPRSFAAVFPQCPGYLCHGNCASLPAQTQIPPLVSLFASMMTQQLLQGLQPPPSTTSVIHQCSSDKVVFCHSLLRHDLNTKQTEIKKHPSWLKDLVCCWKSNISDLQFSMMQPYQREHLPPPQMCSDQQICRHASLGSAG